MSANSSFAGAPQLASNSSVPRLDCRTFTTSMLILTTFSAANILLMLPLAGLVLYLGCRRTRRQRPVPTAATSHSDTFTYHLVAMEIIAALACFLYCVGVNTEIPMMAKYSFNIFFSLWSSKLFFHALTCVEHYLAVVRPITYRGLKGTGGVRVRNISIGCVWLLCFVWGAVVNGRPMYSIGNLYLSLLTLALSVVCFCCLSVLCALQRPSPAEAGGDRERVDQVKRRAFNTVVSIMGVLWLCLGAMLVGNAIENSQVLRETDGCAVVAATFWMSLPSSFVLPLLYLNRAGKLSGCKLSGN